MQVLVDSQIASSPCAEIAQLVQQVMQILATLHSSTFKLYFNIFGYENHSSLIQLLFSPSKTPFLLTKQSKLQINQKIDNYEKLTI